MSDGSSSLKTTARRWIAWWVCRLYAVLPCVVTAIVAGGLAATETDLFGGALIVIFAAALMSLRFPGFRERPLAVIVNGMFFLAVTGLPATWVEATGAEGFALAFMASGLLTLAILWVLPRTPAVVRSVVQPEMFPDALTGLFLGLLFALPARAVSRTDRLTHDAKPPFSVAIILCAYEEEETIDRSLASLKTARDRVTGLAHVCVPKIVLVDSSPTDVTRRRLADAVDHVFEGGHGKLSARHEATLAGDWDIIVAADADREYEPDWLVKLLAPFSDPSVVATMGETRNAGASMSASAWCRATLKMPYNGGNSAYFRAAYLRAPFDVTLNQRKHRALWLEEEFLFGLTLRAQGEVVHLPDCPSYEMRPYPLIAQLARHLLGVRLRTF